MLTPTQHLVLGTPLQPPFPDDTEQAVFGMGCFRGADRPIGFESHAQSARGLGPQEVA